MVALSGCGKNSLDGFGGATPSTPSSGGGSSGSGTLSSPCLTTNCWIGNLEGVLSGYLVGANMVAGAGDGVIGNAADVAVDSTNGYAYVLDVNNYAILKYNLSTGAFVGAIGKTTASTGTCPASGATTGWCTGGTFNSGSGDGMLNSPTQVALDTGNGFLYVADYNRIQKFNLTTGAFVGAVGKTTSSTGTCPASGAAPGWCTGGTFTLGSTDGAFKLPNSIVVDTTNSYIFVADSTNNRVVKLDLTTGAFLGAVGKTTATSGTCPAAGAAPGWCTGGTFASGASDGMFNNPYSLAVDTTNGFLFVTDQYNYRVAKLNLVSGAFMGAVGNTTASSGTCPASGATTGWCTGGTFGSSTGDGKFGTPNGLGINVAGDALYVADSTNASVRKYVLSTGAFVGAIGSTTGTTGTCPASGVASTWCTGGTFTASSSDGGFDFYPNSLAADASGGYLYVPDNNNARVQKINLSTGAFVGAIGEPWIGASAWSQTSGSYRSYKPAGSAQTDGGFQISGGNSVGTAAIDATNGFLYVPDMGSSRLEKFNLSTGAFVGAIGYVTATSGTCVAGAAATGWCTGGTFHLSTVDGGFSQIQAAAVDATHGFLYVADGGNHRIEKFNLSTGAFVGAIGKTTASTGTCPASGAAPGWCTGGTFTNGAGNGMFFYPSDVKVDPANDLLYVVDSTNFRVTKITLSTGAYVGSIGKTSATSGTCPASGAAPGWCTGGTFVNDDTDGTFAYPSGLDIDVTHNALYVGDASNNGKVNKFNLTTGAFIGAIGYVTATSGTCVAGAAATGWCTGGTFSSGSADGQYNAWGVAVDPANGYLYVGDSYNNRVVKVNATTGAFIGAKGSLTGTTGTCPASGAASTWCTGGTFTNDYIDGGYDAANGIAYDSTNGYVYVSDQNNCRLVRVAP